MFNGIFGKTDHSSMQREIREIGELVLKRIDKKISELKTAERAIDEKIETLRNLIERAEEIQKRNIRKEEMVSLYQKGLKIEDIASILGIPSGEVELVLRLCKIYPE